MTIGVPERETARQHEREATGRQRLVTAAPRVVPARRLSGVALYGIALALVGTVGMLYLLQTNYVASLGYEMTQLQQEREALTVENQQLRSELAARQSLSSVERAADTGLGLEPYEPEFYVTVEHPGITPEPAKPPEPATDSRSLLDRFVDRLLGRGVVDSTQADEGQR